MNYYYYQVTGGNEKWRPVPETKLDMLEDAMFCTILSVDNPVTETSPKETFDDLKYRGPLYFDMDDHTAPGSTAKYTVELVNKLSDLSVLPTMLQIYTSGGKGFHVLVPEECFLAKPPKAGFASLPAIYKEMAFELSVQSMDFRVYTARRGRMFRRPNILRPNGLYKVQISWDELQAIADSDDAEAMYRSVSSAPRKALDVESDMPELSSELLALFDLSRAKVSKRRSSKSKQSKVTLPDKLPSLEALLRGEGIKEGTGFHELAFQVAITAHAKGMTQEELLESSTGLCENHQSDGDRYNSPGKRRAELARMWDYMLDNPCYEYSGKAVANLLTHNAPDLRGYEVDADELDLEVPEPNEKGQYDHAGLMLTRRGAFVPTEEGPRQISGLAFDNVTELVSVDNNQVTVMEADVVIAGKMRGRAIFDLDTFNSSTRLNSMYMKYGQSFAGNDVQARGTFLRMVERAQKGDRRMYCVSREGLDVISIPFHDDEELRTPFLVWSDPLEVSPEQRVKDKGLQFKFVGFPKERGSFECDLSMAPSLSQWLKEPGNDLVFREVLTAVMACQKPEYIGKLVGWMIACHYRMIFHKLIGQFPLMHINGAAGSGKTMTTKALAYFHYYNTEPKMMSPSSTIFAFQYAAAGSASIPLLLDEYKPQDMRTGDHERYKLLLRDAYNCRQLEKGGGTRDNKDYRAVHETNLSAPIAYIAEAAESESAVIERSILLTMVKPPAVQAQAYSKSYHTIYSNRHVLSMIGKYIAAGIVRNSGVEQLRAEFMPVFDDAKYAMMLRPGEIASLDNQDRASAKERTVFNYAVAKFGLQKLRNLAVNALGDEQFGVDVFDPALATSFEVSSAVSANTIPEWLKVLNHFAHMTQVDPALDYFLVAGKDYAYVNYGGRDCIELYTISCYYKYRSYCNSSRTKPLFPSQEAFKHSLDNLPATVASGVTVSLSTPGGSHLLDLAELRASGFQAP